MHPAYLKVANNLPHLPGIYKYFDEGATLIYVGKAKDLKKRVASYFTKTFNGFKTHELVQRIATIEFTIVDTEQDAFLLENSLIKQYQPKYNINLKDDKTYPYIVIKKEPFSRIFFTRKKINDGSEYLGPFTNVVSVRELLYFIKQLVPLRNCKLNLSASNIQKNKFKVCLEYHLGNCKGPCQGLQTLEDYNKSLVQVREILKGNVAQVLQVYKKEMLDFAADMQFEKAQLIRIKIEHLENYQEKSVIVSKHITNVDVFSVLKDNNIAIVNYLIVANGTIVQTHTVQLETKLDETEAETLAFAIENLRATHNSISKEIIVPFAIEYYEENITQTIPKVGDKKKLLDLSLKNVNYYQLEIRKQKILHPESKTEQEVDAILQEMQTYLQLQQKPVHIECFDNSNFQGSYPVSAMVCFINGMPSKENFRHYNVKTVEGINDFASMKEVVYRRYKRLIDENKPLPQLVIIDGGKGQLSSALESIKELNLIGKLTLVGLAKNEEEIFFANDSQSLKLPWDSNSLKLIRRIRDEVHNFGITFHRKKRSIGTFKTELENIDGIGEATITNLLKNFKSVKNIKLKTLEELATVVGKSKATIVFEAFKVG
jgi:excinuclease ABC subunit C